MSLPPADVPPPLASRTDEALARLRAATPARVGLGRSGDAIPLGPVLAFGAAHAAARDAVHAPLDTDALAAALGPLPLLRVRSAAPDRATYLRRPDLGRRLDPASAAKLSAAADPAGIDLVVVISDGLSALAVQRHAAPFLRACLERLGPLSLAPVVIATQARVALADEIGERLGARFSVTLIGERPGLSVADSLGAYLTFDPRVGRRDSERNCISNIHAAGGLSYADAAAKLAWLVTRAFAIRATGVTLKDDGMEALVGPD